MSHFYKTVNNYYNICKPITIRQVNYKVNRDISLSLYQNWQRLKHSLFLYIRGLPLYTYSIYLNIFLYIVVHYRPVVYSLNNLISLYIARISYYRRVVYKFEYLKLQGFGIQNYYLLLIVQSIITNFAFSEYNIFILSFSYLNRFYYIYYLYIILIFIFY